MRNRPRPQAGVFIFEAKLRLFAELAGREVAAVDRLRQELVFSMRPELTDAWIGFDHRVPQFWLVVAEHHLFLDFLDIDVLDGIAQIVEGYGSAHGVDL